MALDDQPGGLVKLPCAAVVAQSFPQPQHFFNCARRRAPRHWAGAKESFKIGGRRRRLRLLEHDLAQPDRVRIAAGPPPRQVAGVSRVPRPQATAERPLPRGVGQGHRQVERAAPEGQSRFRRTKTGTVPGYGSLMPWNS